MEISLESLGLTVEQMQNRLVDAMIDRFLTSTVTDEDGEPVGIASQFRQAIQKAITTNVDAAVERLAAPVLENGINAYLDGYMIQSTNGYGEKKREPETITEYIVRRAQEYLTEGVDYNGKSKEEKRKSGSISWGEHRDQTTRVAYLIDKRLNDEIEKAMKTALSAANEAITGGLKSAVVFELAKLNRKLKA